LLQLRVPRAEDRLVVELAAERMDQEPVEVDLGSETRAQADRAAEVQVVGVRDRAVQVAEEQAAVDKRSARGRERGITAARLLFPVWSPVLRGEPLADAASRQKKSFSGFSER
jgi:hypothetical protein